MKNQLKLLDIKTALKDSRFRDSLPIEFQEDVAKFLENPGCSCNINLYRTILKKCSSQLKQYFPNKEISDETEYIKNLAENNWMVIPDCHINDLEAELKKLGPGRKQIAIARYEDRATIIINELDVIF